MTGKLIVALLATVGCAGGPISSRSDSSPHDAASDTVDLDPHDAPEVGAVHEAVVEAESVYPVEVDARVGDRVRWTWRTGTPRTIVSGFACVPDGIFASPTMTTLGTFEIKMPVAGPFPYYLAEDCSVAGVVVVSP